MMYYTITITFTCSLLDEILINLEIPAVVPLCLCHGLRTGKLECSVLDRLVVSQKLHVRRSQNLQNYKNKGKNMGA